MRSAQCPTNSDIHTWSKAFLSQTQTGNCSSVLKYSLVNGFTQLGDCWVTRLQPLLWNALSRFAVHTEKPLQRAIFLCRTTNIVQDSLLARDERSFHVIMHERLCLRQLFLWMFQLVLVRAHYDHWGVWGLKGYVVQPLPERVQCLFE